MLIILTTHPIQYQVPLWQALARDGRVPFEVWYLSNHASKVTHDPAFGTTFAWDLDLLAGYPHRFLEVPADVSPDAFLKGRLSERLGERLSACAARVVWIQGWQVAAYWQAVFEAKRVGLDVWLRGESNDLPRVPFWKQCIKRVVLGALFRRVDKFLCIGTANRRLYEKFGVGAERLSSAPYCVDNARFALQAQAARPKRSELRQKWGISPQAFCVLFCGKFIAKKRPADLVAAARQLVAKGLLPELHLLFVGSGALGEELRAGCRVVFDEGRELGAAESSESASNRPLASFAGFLNQTQISNAYVAADCLVLPSDTGETWGLVVNEAMASDLPCLISDQCGCAEDLGGVGGNAVFGCGDVAALGALLEQFAHGARSPAAGSKNLAQFSFEPILENVVKNYAQTSTPAPKRRPR